MPHYVVHKNETLILGFCISCFMKLTCILMGTWPLCQDSLSFMSLSWLMELCPIGAGYSLGALLVRLSLLAPAAPALVALLRDPTPATGRSALSWDFLHLCC